MDNFAFISVGGYGEYIVAAVLHAVAHVVHHSVVEEVFFEDTVLVGCGTEQQVGELLEGILENVCHVVVKFEAEGAYVHGDYGTVVLVAAHFNLVGNELKVRNGA